MKNNVMATVIIALIVGVAGFFGGMKYNQMQVQRNPGAVFRQFSGNGTFGARNGVTRNGQRLGGRPVVGQIISLDDTSVTVKLPDESTRLVILSGSTVFNKTSEAAKTDLKVGDTIGVFGTDNSDGSVTAQNIQLNPQFRAAVGASGAAARQQ